MSATVPTDLIRPRTITGMSAVLLPMSDGGASIGTRSTPTSPARPPRASSPAVNMDTGYAHLLDPRDEDAGVDRTEAIVGGDFVAGAFESPTQSRSAGEGGDAGDVPERPTAGDDIVAHLRHRHEVDRFIGFELSPVFHPAGCIWDLATYKEVLHVEQCVGAKHSSLDRQPEWDRLALRDAERPDFRVLTGNDLAIDMVMYGSDYLLGLSTFAPDLFAARDRCWADGDPGFYELNDALQHLGNVAFRPPVPAYRHSAALFLRLRGWISSDATPAACPRRPPTRGALLRSAANGSGCGERRLARWPQVKRLRTADAFRQRLDELGDRRCRSPTRLRSTRSPRRSRSPAAEQPTGSRSCRWRVGRHRGRTADGPRSPALGAVRHERRRAGVGRRGVRGRRRRSGESTSALPWSVVRRRSARAARAAGSDTGRRSAAHALGAMVAHLAAGARRRTARRACAPGRVLSEAELDDSPTTTPRPPCWPVTPASTSST